MEKLALSVVTKFINEWDPMHLNGAPEDEYEYEITLITKVVLNSRDEIEVAEGIKETMDYSIQGDFDFDNCLCVARRIWTNLYE